MAPTTCPSATMSGSKRTPMTPVAPAKKILIPLPHIASLVYIASACTIAKTVALSKTRIFEREVRQKISQEKRLSHLSKLISDFNLSINLLKADFKEHGSMHNRKSVASNEAAG